ncbi:hypothetical protein [Pedobacter sp. GR22-6]|uniref:hypothetical protein n=1 Tax=Pedobacter sp. GR22-6 TaxID=3127957 RepID=UPI00307D73D7
MEGILVLSLLYWIAVGALFLVGIVKLLVAMGNNTPAKPGLQLLIISVVMLVIGFGACAAMMSGFSVR